MFDRGLFWSPLPDWPDAAIEAQGLSIRPVTTSGLICIVSGNLDAFLAHEGLQRCLGPRDLCDGSRYALRLAPDRMLFVRDDAFVGADADSRSLPARVAVSDVTDGFLGFDLAGHGAADLIRLGTTYDFTDPTPRLVESTLMEFAGFKVAIVRRESGWRLYVERPVAAALWHWFEKVS